MVGENKSPGESIIMGKIKGLGERFLPAVPKRHRMRGRLAGSGQSPSGPGSVAGVGTGGRMQILKGTKEALIEIRAISPAKVTSEGECQ